MPNRTKPNGLEISQNEKIINLRETAMIRLEKLRVGSQSLSLLLKTNEEYIWIYKIGTACLCITTIHVSKK
jgi:hypothetical protein